MLVPETYGRGGARQLEWQTHRNAIAEDPENRFHYGEHVLTLARHLILLCVWPPVVAMLRKGPEEDPE